MFFVYILASKPNGTLYVGFTHDLVRRIFEHQQNVVEGFTKEYGVKNLVYWEAVENRDSALLREKQLKKWNRAWKIRLIDEKNPMWKDLYSEITLS